MYRGRPQTSARYIRCQHTIQYAPAANVSSCSGGGGDGHWSDRLVIRSVLVNAPGPRTPSFEGCGRPTDAGAVVKSARGLFHHFRIIVCTRTRIYIYVYFIGIINICFVLYFSHIFTVSGLSFVLHIIIVYHIILIYIKYYMLGRLSYVPAVV